MPMSIGPFRFCVDTDTVASCNARSIFADQFHSSPQALPIVAQPDNLAYTMFGSGFQVSAREDRNGNATVTESLESLDPMLEGRGCNFKGLVIRCEKLARRHALHLETINGFAVIEANRLQSFSSCLAFKSAEGEDYATGEIGCDHASNNAAGKQ
jgi:hypothetical protein